MVIPEPIPKLTPEPIPETDSEPTTRNWFHKH